MIDFNDIKIKDGVQLKEINKYYLQILYAVSIAWKHYAPGIAPVITSGSERVNGRLNTSKHYTHMALDLRTRNLSRAIISNIVHLLRNILPGYDVVYERERRHIHIEYDPK